MSKTTEINDFIKRASNWPFKRGGRDESGVDCYGMVVMFYKLVHGIALPEVDYGRYVDALSTDNVVKSYVSGPFDIVDSPVVGGIVGFRDGEGFVTHLGIWLGEGRVLDCSEKGIRITRLRKGLEPIYYVYNHSNTDC